MDEMALGSALLLLARENGLAVYLRGARLQVRGPAQLKRLATVLHSHERAVVAALWQYPVPHPEWNEGGGDQDQPFAFGAFRPSVLDPWPFTLEQFLHLRALKSARGQARAATPGPASS